MSTEALSFLTSERVVSSRTPCSALITKLCQFDTAVHETLYCVRSVPLAQPVMPCLRYVFIPSPGSLLPFAVIPDPGLQVPSTIDVAALLFNSLITISNSCDNLEGM